MQKEILHSEHQTPGLRTEKKLLPFCFGSKIPSELTTPSFPFLSFYILDLKYS